MSDIELPDLSQRASSNSNSNSNSGGGANSLVPVAEGGGAADDGGGGSNMVVVGTMVATESQHSAGNDSGNHSMSTNASREFLVLLFLFSSS